MNTLLELEKPLIKVCAWCESEQGVDVRASRPEVLVSHGICPRHREVILEQVGKWQVGWAMQIKSAPELPPKCAVDLVL